MKNAQVVLCTIASTSRVASEMPESTIHTVIVDEAGATSEVSMPLLLRLQPRNIVLVGDHFQLPPSIGGGMQVKGDGDKKA